MTQTRITAGEWRGRLIDTPAGSKTRPTSSKVREAIFNILGDRVDDARVLDLYAGAATFSFEALSRGAAQATVVERDPKVVALIAKTAARLECVDQIEMVTADVTRWLSRQDQDGLGADIVWLDPPYKDAGIEALLEKISRHTPPLVVCEHHRARPPRDRIGNLVATRRANYGQTTLSFYQPEGSK